MTVEHTFQSELVMIIHCYGLLLMFLSNSSKLSLKQKSWASLWDIIQKASELQKRVDYAKLGLAWRVKDKKPSSWDRLWSEKWGSF